MEDANTQSGNPRARTKPPAEATQNPHLAGGVEMDGSHAFTLDQRRAAFSENNEEAVYAQGGSSERNRRKEARCNSQNEKENEKISK